MKRPTVWFNKHLSNTWEAIAALAATGEFRLVSTHPRARYPARDICDVFEEEPIGLSDDAYVEYCLDVCRRHEVDLFLPGRKVLPIVRAARRFAPRVQVLAAGDADALELLANKARVYDALAGDVCVPEHAAVRDVDSFDLAWERLRSRHRLLCCKPAVSVYGFGFHIIAERGHALERLQAGDRLYVSHAEARARLHEPRERLLMPHLPGPERSVDCLAQDGELIACVVRRKQVRDPSGIGRQVGQVLEHNPDVETVVRRITRRLRLHHLFNVQFRNAGGRSYLLEINARMSGGLPFTFESGLNLPLWGIRLALGRATPADVPPPRTGIWVPQPAPARSL